MVNLEFGQQEFQAALTQIESTLRLSSLKSGVCSGLVLSGALNPDLKIGVCLRPELRPRVRRRMY
jgi:hypothetical protein